MLEWKIALPLHPEYRTLPMVWYIPPLSPIMNLAEGKGSPAQPDDVFDMMRICGFRLNTWRTCSRQGIAGVIRRVLKKMAVMRSDMRSVNLGKKPDKKKLAEIGMDAQTVEEMYRLLAIAKYEDRFVIPTAHKEVAVELLREQGSCGLSFAGGPGSCGVF